MSERLRPELAANRANWDDRAVVHARSTDYDVDGLVADPARISTVVLNDLDVLAPHLPDGSVRGLSLLHLQMGLREGPAAGHAHRNCPTAGVESGA